VVHYSKERTGIIKLAVFVVHFLVLKELKPLVLYNLLHKMNFLIPNCFIQGNFKEMQGITVRQNSKPKILYIILQ